ncbi:MAG: CpaD family pilus assembly lipoprotein [Alphaproteobacteria bacterium]
MTVKHANRPLRAAILPAAVALLLGACSAQPIYPEAAGVEKVNRVEWKIERHPVRFGLGATTPPPAEIARLDRFVQPFVNDPAARVYIDAAPAAAGDAVAQHRYHGLAAWLEAKGLRPGALVEGVPGAVAATDPHQAVVYVGRYHVVLPDCPDWRKQTGADFTNTPSSNFGCATTVNFARMLADPGDLVQGRDPGPSDGERMAATIRGYREAARERATAGTQAVSTTGGTN